LKSTPRLFAGLLAATALACGPSATPVPTETEAPVASRANVLLVTVDTLRADRVGVYGFGAVETPAIDALAASGVMFEAAYSPIPLTLPAHTSIMTGTYPVQHGVRDNMAYRLPSEMDTLAEVLEGEGYRTGAFVSAFVLDSQWGLDRGFETYFDEFDTGGQVRFLMGAGQEGLDRTADEVVDQAIEWLQANDGRPFFLWVHLFDPHAPYAPPEPFRTRYADDLYLGEIAFVDSQIGRLIDQLGQLGLRDQTVIGLTADHGEGLGEHGEVQHGLFIYEEAIRVPLIFSAPSNASAGVTRSEPVSLVDVAPTLLALAGAPTLAGIEGQDLTPRFDPTVVVQPRPVYSESLYGKLHYGWSELHAVIEDRYKLIDSSAPELFDLGRDPKEKANLAGELNTVYLRLHNDLAEREARWATGAQAADTGAVASETRQRLQALGYVASVRELDEDSDQLLPSPRERIGVFNKTLTARAAINRGYLLEAETLLGQVVAEDAGVPEAQRMLAEVYTKQQRHREAAEVLRAAIPLSPSDAESHLLLADALAAVGDLDGAELALETALGFVDPSADIQLALGSTRARKGDLPGAASAFEVALELNPDSEHAHSGLAQLYLGMNDMRRAREHAAASLALDPAMPRAHFVLAEVARREGDIGVATEEYEAELANEPGNVLARFNLAMAYRETGRAAEELGALNEVVRRAPEFIPGGLMLGRALLEQDTRLVEARRVVQGALDATTSDRERLLGYQLMADLSARLGDTDGSARWAELVSALRRQLEG